MKTLAILSAVAAAAGLTAVVTVHAGHGGHGHHGGGAMMLPHIVDELAGEILDGAGALNLTEDQKQRVTAVRDRVMAQAKTLHVAHDATHDELKKEWDGPSMDKLKMQSLVDARVKELREVLFAAVDATVEIHDILTPAQRKLLSDRFEARHREK